MNNYELMRRIKEDIKQQGAEDEKSIANIVVDKYMMLTTVDYEEIKPLYEIIIDAIEQARLKGIILTNDTLMDLQSKNLCAAYYNRACLDVKAAIKKIAELHKELSD